MTGSIHDWLDSEAGTRFRYYSSIASFTLLCWDYMSSCRIEYEYIWKGKWNRSKFIYLYARYSTLIIQAANLIIMDNPISRRASKSSTQHFCRVLSMGLYAGCAMTFIALSILLMLNVYVLYGRSKIITAVLGVGFTVPMVATIIAGKRGIYESYDSACNMKANMAESIFLGASVCANHSMLWFLTMAKRKLGHGKAAVVKLVVRNGAFMFILILILMAICAPFAAVTGKVRPYLIFIWPSSLLSIATCKIVVNMHRLKVEPSRSPTDIELTTIYDSIFVTRTAA